MDNKNEVVKKEEEILAFWKEKNIFKKSLDQRNQSPVFSFYDGPPFATGLPHYGHIVPSLMKDIIPRYQTMKGNYVERRWGWDCHGLPVENIVENELGLKSKKDIEEVGIEKFNETCRGVVMKFQKEWRATIERMGRWVDMDNDYKTMDLEYMESIWWVFKELWDKGLIYESYKSMHICPRCETTLSQSEVAEGYKDIRDISVIAKFELQDEPKTYVLAWTTTPWTLPGNVALAMGEDIEYALVRSGDEKYILAKENVERLMEGKNYEIAGSVLAKDLEGKKYKPLFPWDYSEFLKNQNTENLYTIHLANFVTVEDGTGVVHIAPAFGEDDMNLGKEKNLPFIQHVGYDGRFRALGGDFSGMEVKPRGSHTKTDEKIVSFLEELDRVFLSEEYTHSYPHCWRCETPLLNYATTSWFVAVTKIKNELLKNAEEIRWIPAHVKTGRFGNWLEGARDWAISRQRFWGSVMPVWRCECSEMRAFGSVKELEKASGEKISDLHKHVVDAVVVPCGKCGKDMKRIPDVLDCWFESGSMPYAQVHYPFENKEKFEKSFPADFIAEGVDQTRAWFYYLHVIAGAIKGSVAFQNVDVNGIVLAEDGKKMSKRLKNYPAPEEIFEKYGADAMRYYLATSGAVRAEDLHFSEKEVIEVFRNVIMLTNNILRFYKTYEDTAGEFTAQPKNILDRWILANFKTLLSEMTLHLDDYDIMRAARPIEKFIQDFSTWYLRRSRARFKDGDPEGIALFGHVLREFSKAIAPFMPFLAERVYNEAGGSQESVHLEDWPETEVHSQSRESRDLLEEMETTRKIVEFGLAKRAEEGIKVRQPLRALYVTGSALRDEFIPLVKDELNVKEVDFSKGEELRISLDTNITKELEMEGDAREFIRYVNQERRKQGLTISDRVKLYVNGDFVESLRQHEKDILKTTLADSMEYKSGDEKIVINGKKGTFSIIRA